MTLKACIDYIRSDYYRITGRKNDCLLKMWAKTILDTGFHFLFWFRLAKCDNFLIMGGGRIFSRLIGTINHICIERVTNIGYGFRIVHGGPVVINASAVIGNNVDIYQFCSIGSQFFTAAEIQDDVFISPNVCIVEHVRIGKGATIGAGSVVVKDVADGATVAGNPAKTISNKTPGRLILNKWNLDWNKA